MLNSVTLQGRFCADADLRHTQAGRAFARFRVAVERNYKDSATGERGTDWINCTSWGQQAEMIARYFRKGDMIVLRGRIQTSTYTDRDGQNRTSVEVAVDEVNFAGGKRETTAAAPQQAAAPAPVPPVFEPIEDDGGLPF